jgi:hypothetical protein
MAGLPPKVSTGATPAASKTRPTHCHAVDGLLATMLATKSAPPRRNCSATQGRAVFVCAYDNQHLEIVKCAAGSGPRGPDAAVPDVPLTRAERRGILPIPGAQADPLPRGTLVWRRTGRNCRTTNGPCPGRLPCSERLPEISSARSMSTRE